MPSFRTSGNTPQFTDSLKRKVSGFSKKDRFSFTTIIDKLSDPKYDLFGRDKTAFRMSVPLKPKKPNEFGQTSYRLLVDFFLLNCGRYHQSKR